MPMPTLISNEINIPPVASDAQRMVLHARAASNIAEDQDLSRDFLAAIVSPPRRRDVLRRQREESNGQQARQPEGDGDGLLDHGFMAAEDEGLSKADVELRLVAI